MTAAVLGGKLTTPKSRCAVILKLNKVDVLLGTLVVNPLTLPAVAAVAIPIGRFLLRARREAIAHLPWHDMFRRSFWTTAAPAMKAIGLQMAVGMFFLAAILGALTYVTLVYLIRHHRAKLAARARSALIPPSP